MEHGNRDSQRTPTTYLVKGDGEALVGDQRRLVRHRLSDDPGAVNHPRDLNTTESGEGRPSKSEGLR